jgi:opacity protein-like surface antigen
MKKLIATSLAVLIAAPAFAGGQQYQQETTSFLGWDILPYVALRGGATYGNLNYSLNHKKEDVSQNLYQVRTALGLTIYDTARFEVEGSFFTKGSKKETFSGLDADITSKNIELMANTYMNIGHFKCIQPFVGLGAGLAFVETEARTAAKNISRDDTKFSGMGALGLAMPFGQFEVDITARYNYVDVDSGLHYFSGDVGIRYMF